MTMSAGKVSFRNQGGNAEFMASSLEHRGGAFLRELKSFTEAKTKVKI